MAAPLATEKVLRATLQALQRGGLILSGSDVAALEGVPNNASNADISTILDGMTFGGAGAVTDIVRGDGDVNVFIDANNNNFGYTDQRFFRVAEDQSNPPVTDPDNELMTVSRFHEPNDWVTDLLVGPRTALATGDHHAVIRVGTDTAAHYGTIRGSSTAVGGLKGLLINSPARVGVQANNSIVFANANGNYIRGGWANPQGSTSFHVGDHIASPQESLAFESETSGGTPMYTIRPSYDGAAVRRVYFRGSNSVSGYRCFFSVGGKANETWGDPNNFGNPTFMVVGDTESTVANSAYVYDRKTARTAGSEVFTIKSEAASGGLFYYLRVLDKTGTGIFSVTGDGTTAASDVNAPNGFTTGAADVAETVQGDAEYCPGTVLAIQNGLLTSTTDVAQSNVAGVVATQPGMLLGTDKQHCRDNEFILSLCTAAGETRVLIAKQDVRARVGQYIRTTYRNVIKIASTNLNQWGNTEIHLEGSVAVYEGIEIWAGIVRQQNLNRMAITGIVPVQCSTVGGDILGSGETLVSGPDGTAVVDHSPLPGTIIGKAIGKLQGEGATGLIDVLVNLQ